MEPVKGVKPVKQALLLLLNSTFTAFTGSQVQNLISRMNYTFSHPHPMRAEKPDLRTVKGVKAVKSPLKNSSHYRRRGECMTRGNPPSSTSGRYGRRWRG